MNEPELSSIPERLHQNGRTEDSEFLSSELLYFRCDPTHVDGDYQVLPAAFRFPDFSVNRGKYSEPADVLLPNWPSHGVFSVAVGDLPAAISTGSGQSATEYSFSPAHVPLLKNYSHSEIRTSKNGSFSSSLGTPSTVKTHFRLHMKGKAALIVRPPSDQQ